MKKWMSVLLSAVILCGCGKADEQPKEEPKQEVDKKPNIEIKVNPPKDKQPKKEKQQPKKDKNKAKQKETKSEEKPTNITTTPTQSAPSYDTDRYNLARHCLITPGKEKEADCQEIGNTPEYSKAWNNLTSEGYICQSGQCNLAQQPATEEKVEEQKEAITNEQKNTVPIETQVIPAKPVKDKTTEPKPVEPPKPTEPVEPKTTEVKTPTQPDKPTEQTKPTEPKTTTKSSTTQKQDTTQKLKTTVQDNTDANN